MKLEIVNVATRSGTNKEGKPWILSTVHVRTPKGDFAEVKVWDAVKVVQGALAEPVWELRTNFKDKSVFGVIVGFKE
jgi:hypothetical protein